MNLTPGHFTLSPAQRHVKTQLEAYPYRQPYWDVDQRELDTERLKKTLGVLSHSEAIMARFFANLWLGDNTFAFDLIEAANTLDADDRTVIARWLADPTFP